MAGEHDESLPIDHTKIGSIPGEIRKVTANVETVIIKEHEDLGSGNSGGQHRLGSAVANEGSTTPTKTVDITAGSVALANIARDRGRLWLDDNFDPPVLKRWAGAAWEVVGTIAAGVSPNLAKLISTTAEDTDGGRESALVFKGTQSGAEETTLGLVEFSHEGASDDQKGQWKIKVNDGDDGDAPSKIAMVGKSTGKIDASESVAILDEDDMASDDADCLATQQSIKAYLDGNHHIIQVVNSTVTAAVDCTSTIPVDDTVPQVAEGDEITTLAITPKSTDNKLLIQIDMFGDTDGAKDGVIALFDNGDACIAATMQYGADAPSNLSLTHYMSAPATSEQTFKVRGGDIEINGVGGTRVFGGKASSSITITELKD